MCIESVGLSTVASLRLPPTEVIIKSSGISLTVYNYRVQLIEFLMLGSFVSIWMAQ